MGYLVKQSTTARPLLFLMIDSADHVAGKTGLSPTVTISKNGAVFGSPAGAVSEVGNGWYAVSANATDSNTLGVLALHATAVGADPTDELFEIVAFNPDLASMGLSLAKTTNLTGLNDITAPNVRTELATELARIDAAVSSRSSHSAADVWAVTTRTLTSFGSLVADIWSYATRTLSAFAHSVALAASQPNYVPAKAGDAMALTPAERGAIGDAVRTELSSELSYLDVAVSSRATQSSVDALDSLAADIKSQTDQLDDLIEDTGVYLRFTAEALEEAPAGGGGGGGLTEQDVRNAVGLSAADLGDRLAEIKTSADAALRPVEPGRDLAVNPDGSVNAGVTLNEEDIDDIVDGINESGVVTSGFSTTAMSQLAGIEVAPRTQLAKGGDLEVIAGDDYLDADGHALGIPLVGAGVGGLIGDGWELRLEAHNRTVAVSTTFTASAPHADSLLLAFDVPRAATALLAPDERRCGMWQCRRITNIAQHELTIASGRLIVRRLIGDPE